MSSNSMLYEGNVIDASAQHVYSKQMVFPNNRSNKCFDKPPDVAVKLLRWRAMYRHRERERQSSSLPVTFSQSTLVGNRTIKYWTALPLLPMPKLSLAHTHSKAKITPWKKCTKSISAPAWKFSVNIRKFECVVQLFPKNEVMWSSQAHFLPPDSLWETLNATSRHMAIQLYCPHFCEENTRCCRYSGTPYWY